MDNSITERSRGICPTGFHIPSDCEWMYLEHGQGMSITEQNRINFIRASSANNEGTPGYKLRSQGGSNTNASGFSGLLSGIRTRYGTYVLRTGDGFWWSSTISAPNFAIFRQLITNDRGVFRHSYDMGFGFSVRCLKD